MERRKAPIPSDEEDLAIREAIASAPDTWEVTDEQWANMEPGDPFTIRALLARSFKRGKTALTHSLLRFWQ